MTQQQQLTRKPRMTKKLKAEIETVNEKYNNMLYRNYNQWEKLKNMTLKNLYMLDLSYDNYSVYYDNILDTMDEINLVRIRIREKKERALHKVLNNGEKKTCDYSADYKLENRSNKQRHYYNSYKIDLKLNLSPVLREMVRDFNYGVDMTEDEFKCIQQSNRGYEMSCGMSYKKYREIQIKCSRFKRMEKHNARKMLLGVMNNDCIVNICQFI